MPPPEVATGIPVFLLKTKSTPTDAYEDLLATEQDRGQRSFLPCFIPVLHHRFEEPGLGRLRSLLQTDDISTSSDSRFGGLIFTSQRAVEALAKLVDDGTAPSPTTATSAAEEPSTRPWPNLGGIPVYSVGPATTRAIKAIQHAPRALDVFGEHTGNGDALARFILDHYIEHYRRLGHTAPPRPLLFPVGEQRRDIIPKTLMDDKLPADRRIEVVEEVVYGTGVMESFPVDFAKALDSTANAAERWVVVFSPTGCDSMLRGLGLLDPVTGKFKQSPDSRDGKTFIATIGPTTRQHLVSMFDFEPDVCAEKPSPEGVLQGILDYKANTSR
jgi:uroporphyrinogen-III synthase